MFILASTSTLYRYVVNFDFVGKSSVPYHNTVEVEEMVFTNLEEFISNKQPKERVFDRLNPAYLNRYLGKLMPGLTIKVFRTYRASITMQEQLAALTRGFHDDKQKKASYKKASDEVAKLLNHKRRNGGQREKMWRFLLQETTEDVASVIEQMQGLRIRSTRVGMGGPTNFRPASLLITPNLNSIDLFVNNQLGNRTSNNVVWDIICICR
ncbi:hypothetical protein ANCDUO_15042 [Ancylostoma duodenale]|uniref:DNA topoisomerase n=1 Tax=Ancylostoma duodenale TaxID=51022 RepID=A0A0C2G7C5_9BILA|nr:hypothetical protein ANCDUO_15042 [Ancylostoma duodenale]